MALGYADRVKETTTTSGTGTINLAGAVSGFRTFVAGIGSGNPTYYTIVDGTAWEVGIGTVTDATPDTLSRTLIASSTGSLISLSGGSADVFCTAPGSRFGGRDRLAFGSVSSAANLPIVLTGYTMYKRLYLELEGWRPATDAVHLRLRTSTDGGSTYDSGASDYKWTYTGRYSSGSLASSSTADTYIALTAVNSGGFACGNASEESLASTIVFHNLAFGATHRPKISYQTDYIIDSSVDLCTTWGNGMRATTADIDAIQLLFSSGNIAEGDWSLYGTLV